MEEPEIIKMLKYILLISFTASLVQCHPLVTEQPAVVPVPFHHSGEQYSEVVPSLISAAGGNKHKIPVPETTSASSSVTPSEQMRMSPVSDIRDMPDEQGQRNSGGQKHVRQVSEERSSQSGAPPPSDELGSLCSIFQFFLEPRRYSSCRISNTPTENERNEGLVSSSLRGGIDSEDGFGFNSNYHRPVPNEVTSDQTSGSDNFQSESENREIESEQQRPLLRYPPRMELDQNTRRDDREPPASKRYDHIEEIQLHEQPPGEDEHHHHLVPPGPPPMFPKSSLDRTTIIVPERPCPRGERRDHKGYCRRIVRRPSYQYGPPPPPYGHGPPRPYRYYYSSRYVSVPTLQFYIPKESCSFC